MSSMFIKVLLYIFLIKVHNINCIQETCTRKGSCEKIKRDDNAIYFGLMLSYPDPLGRESLASIFDDGHDIAPAAYLAVEQINNRSDLLTDYHVQLIRVDGGCTVTERTVVGINKLVCSCEPIIGIIGPSCATSSLIVGQLTAKEQFSMVTIHYGEQNTFENRNVYPFAFGMLGANFINIEAFTHLIIRNNWTRVALLYSEHGVDPVEVSTGILRNIKNTPGYDVAFASPIYEHFIPLQDVKQSFARVVIVIASAKLTLRTLCLAFHEQMIFPVYQWVFRERFDYEFKETSFSYKGIHNFCSEEDISTSIFESVNLVRSLDLEGMIKQTVEDSLPLMEYEDGYKQQRDRYVKQYNVSSTPTEWATGFYDAAWSLAFALNSSLGELRMNLTQVVPGSKVLAQTIANHMSEANFQGVSGRINFDQMTGFNTARKINIYRFGKRKSSTLIGFYASKELAVLNDTKSHFVKSTFDTKHIHVSAAVAVPFLIATVAMLLFAVPMQVINIIYRKHSTIKATSPKLNHLIFLGCYLTVIGTVLYIATEAWPQTLKSYTVSNLCKALPWFLSIGTTLVIGTVFAKTWRLYYIYNSSKKGTRLNLKLVSDPVLGVIVGVLTSIDILLCLIWSSADPLKVTTTRTISESLGEELPMILVMTACRSTWLGYWTGVIIIYKGVLTVCSFLLALFTRMRQRHFQTNNVIILSYILAVTVGLGIPLYTIISTVSASTLLRFIIVCMFLDTIIYVCLFALFLPSAIPFLKEKFSMTTMHGVRAKPATDSE